jgi:hypothetical protein
MMYIYFVLLPLGAVPTDSRRYDSTAVDFSNKIQNLVPVFLMSLVYLLKVASSVCKILTAYCDSDMQSRHILVDEWNFCA